MTCSFASADKALAPCHAGCALKVGGKCAFTILAEAELAKAMQLKSNKHISNITHSVADKD